MVGVPPELDSTQAHQGGASILDRPVIERGQSLHTQYTAESGLATVLLKAPGPRRPISGVAGIV